MKTTITGILLIIGMFISDAAAKTLYIPSSIKKMDLNSQASQWCYDRSRESENVVVFWEAGYGSEPSKAAEDKRVDIDTLLGVAEKAYTFYRDTLQFVIKGSSLTDSYKMIIYLKDTTLWTANGAGEDDIVGSLRVNARAANTNNVVAHELGHCFEYMTKRDAKDGFDYGLGENGKGGNGFWEQCANWMSFKVYPEKQFTENDFKEYCKNNHLHILHEKPRYANYFLPDFWCYKHDITFMGKLWRESVFPEDPVETYKRLNSLTQAQFNDEMYEHAARLTTWDIPAIKQNGEKYIDSRTQVKMIRSTEGYWRIDSSVCIENYGYASIKLNPPATSQGITVKFRGKTGTKGYRQVSPEKGGWRFGFVSLHENGSREYSETGMAIVTDGKNPDQTLTFTCPGKCKKVWLVVSGAPQEHWKHAWDDSTYNDEQWPFEVAFVNTNLLGEITDRAHIPARRANACLSAVNHPGCMLLPRQATWKMTSLTGQQIMSGYGTEIDTRSCARGGYILHYDGRSMKIMIHR